MVLVADVVHLRGEDAEEEVVDLHLEVGVDSLLVVVVVPEVVQVAFQGVVLAVEVVSPHGVVVVSAAEVVARVYALLVVLLALGSGWAHGVPVVISKSALW